MMVYKYKKPYRIRKKKSVFRNPFFKIGVLILVAIAGISYFLFFSDFFRVKNIRVSGNEKILSENIEKRIREEMLAEYGDNIFLFGELKIKNILLGAFPEIAQANISVNLPDTMNVEIEERKPAAIFCQEEKCSFADQGGNIFGEVSDEVNLIRIFSSGLPLTAERISQIMEIHEKLKSNLSVTTTQAIIASEERLNVKTSEGWEIYFNLKGDLSWQITELGLVLEKQISPAKRKNLDYIDLRFSRVYYK